jgi:O-antigen/teichoic acid export membrane protein
MRAAAVPVAFVLVNILSYALLVAGAHLLSSAAYGRLSSLLGLLLIATIPMLALQTVAARRAATSTGSAGIARGTALIGCSGAALLAALSPALAQFLRLHEVTGILLVAATVPSGAVLGTAMGVAQGRRDFARLAALIATTTGGRSAAGLVGLFAGRTPNWTLAGVAIGMALAAVLVAATRPRLAEHLRAVRDRSRAGVLVETLNAGYAHGTFLLLTSLDVLLARHVLSGTQAGVYSAGSVVTRIAVWLPQAVIVLMFASLSESARHHRTARQAVGVVLGIGVVLVAGSAVTGPILVAIVGGAKYSSLDHRMWLFTLLGSLLAVVQLCVLAGLAQRTARRAVLLWLTVAVDLAAVLGSSSGATPTRLVGTLTGIAGGAAAVAVWLTLRTPRADTLRVHPAIEGVVR